MSRKSNQLIFTLHVQPERHAKVQYVTAANLICMLSTADHGLPQRLASSP